MPGPADYIDSEVARYRRELEEVLDEITRKLRAALDRARTSDGSLVRDAATLRLLQRAGEEAAAQLDGAVSDIAARFRATVAELTGRIGADLAKAGVGTDPATAIGTTSAALQRGGGLDALIAQATRDLKSVAPDLRDNLRAVATKMLRSPINPAEAVERLAGKVGASVGQTLSLVDVTLSGTSRATTLLQAEDAGVRWFLYDGPAVDSITRPFCAKRLGYLFHASELDETENDTGPQPPSVYQGGWGCRHAWVPIRDDEARNWPRWKGRSYDRR